MTQRTLLLTNPGSRSGKDQAKALSDSLSGEGEVHAIQPDKPEQLPQAIREHGPRVDRIVLGGGDGTVNLALDALLEVDKPTGLIPLGTANDLARTLGIPDDIDEALAVIKRGHLRSVDVSRADDVSFINAIGLGLGPSMTREMDSDTKARLGVLAYLVGIVRAFRGQKAFKARIETDRGQHQGKFLQITVANGVHYGGGMTIAEDARIDDGCLDVLLVRQQSRLELLANALRFKTGDTRTANWLTHTRCRRVSIKTNPSLEFTADGEFLGKTPLECTIKPSALRVFAPDTDN